MANPRRSSYSNTQPTTPTSLLPETTSQLQPQTQTQTQTHFLSLSSIIHFLKKPHAFPFLLSIFLLLTWASLRLQHLTQVSSQQSHQSQHTQNLKRSNSGPNDDKEANLVRFSSGVLSAKDKRGWLLDPITAAHDAGLSGGAVFCASVHVGQIRPGGVRANHRHKTCNETFIIWGAETRFRLENPKVEKGYAEVTIGSEEVAVSCSPSGRAHALVNVDPVRTTFFLGCQDKVISYNTSTDFNVWNNL